MGLSSDICSSAHKDLKLNSPEYFLPHSSRNQ